jgi:hypothetical protein
MLFQSDIQPLILAYVHSCPFVQTRNAVEVDGWALEAEIAAHVLHAVDVVAAVPKIRQYFRSKTAE